MNRCQYYMLHINLHILYIHFIKFNLNLKEFQESNNYFKSYQVNKIEYYYELYFNWKFPFKFEYQTRFSGKFMIQYITTLITYEHKRILFHVTPCHDGSY